MTPQAGTTGKFDISFIPVDVGDHSVEVCVYQCKTHLTQILE